MGPIVREMAASARIHPFVIATGQHPGIVEEIFATNGLDVDVNLDVGRTGSTLNDLFARILKHFEAFFVERFGVPQGSGAERDYDHMPAACLVHGDTTSAAAAAVACFHLQIPIAHIEAGLRTSDVRSPFPEELNRQIVSRIAAFHLAPTMQNLENLVRERVPADRVFVTGNSAIDSLLTAAEWPADFDIPELEFLNSDHTSPIVVVTAHRRENWGAGLSNISAAISELATRFPEVRFVLPVHPNPKVEHAIRPRLSPHPNVILVPPVRYVPFAKLLKRASLVITDSGGIQEEAPTLAVPVIVMRETTERQEGVDAGTLTLVGTDVDRIVAAASELLTDPDRHAEVSARNNPYGDGRAAERIVAAMEHIAFGTQAPAAFGAGFSRLAVLRAGGFDGDTRGPTTGPAAADVIPPRSVELVEQALRD